MVLKRWARVCLNYTEMCILNIYIHTCLEIMRMYLYGPLLYKYIRIKSSRSCQNEEEEAAEARSVYYPREKAYSTGIV